MSAPSIIAVPDPPKAWVETIQRALRSYNTAATGIVEFYPVVFLVKDSGNNVLGAPWRGHSTKSLAIRSLAPWRIILKDIATIS